VFSNNDKLYIPISGGTGWTKVPMNSNYPSQEIGKDGNMYAPVSEVNKPRTSAPIISNTNTSVVQDSRAYNPTSLYVDGLYNSTPESRMNYYYIREKQQAEEAKRQQEALITANINKALDIAASTQYRIMDKLYIEGGLDAMRKEYYRLSAGTEGYNSVYARAAYNSLCAKDKEEVPIREVTMNAANKYYNEGGIEGLKHLINYYKSNGYFNYASVAQSILSTKEKEEIIHTPEVTKGANHYYETGGIESLNHLVKYYGENNYPVYANIAKKILKQKEEQEHEKLKQNFDTAIQEAERILKLNDIDVPREKVIKIFSEHLDLKISEKGIEDSLVKLGWVGSKETGVPENKEGAFIRGVQQFVYQNREEFKAVSRLEFSDFKHEQELVIGSKPPTKEEDSSWWKMAKKAFNGDRSQEVLDWQKENRDKMRYIAAVFDGIHEGVELFDEPLKKYKLEVIGTINEGEQNIDNALQDKDLNPTQELLHRIKKVAYEVTDKVADTVIPESMTDVGLMVGTLGAGTVTAKIVTKEAGKLLFSYKLYRKVEQIDRPKITGGRTVKEEMARENLAIKMYEEIRNCSNDVQQIAKNLNLQEFQVQRVKDHLFYKKHQLDHGQGIGRFDPDLDIANAWKNFEKGVYSEADLKIFKHEHFESKFEGIFKTDYSTAHDAANRAGYPSGLRNNDIIEVKNGNANLHK